MRCLCFPCFAEFLHDFFVSPNFRDVVRAPHFSSKVPHESSHGPDYPLVSLEHKRVPPIVPHAVMFPRVYLYVSCCSSTPTGHPSFRCVSSCSCTTSTCSPCFLLPPPPEFSDVLRSFPTLPSGCPQHLGLRRMCLVLLGVSHKASLFSCCYFGPQVFDTSCVSCCPSFSLCVPAFPPTFPEIPRFPLLVPFPHSCHHVSMYSLHFPYFHVNSTMPYDFSVFPMTSECILVFPRCFPRLSRRPDCVCLGFPPPTTTTICSLVPQFLDFPPELPQATPFPHVFSRWPICHRLHRPSLALD